MIRLTQTKRGWWSRTVQAVTTRPSSARTPERSAPVDEPAPPPSAGARRRARRSPSLSCDSLSGGCSVAPMFWCIVAPQENSIVWRAGWSVGAPPASSPGGRPGRAGGLERERRPGEQPGGLAGAGGADREAGEHEVLLCAVEDRVEPGAQLRERAGVAGQLAVDAVEREGHLEQHGAGDQAPALAGSERGGGEHADRH